MNRINQILFSLCLLLLGASLWASLNQLQAQSVGLGVAPAAAYCTTVASCPAVTGQQSMIYIVTPTGSQPFLALAYGGWNGGAAVQQTFPAGTAGITSINGVTPNASGAVTLTGANLFPLGMLSCPLGTVGPNGLTCPSGLILK